METVVTGEVASGTSGIRLVELGERLPFPLPELAGAESLGEPRDLLDPDGRLPVEDLIRWFEREHGSRRPTVIVTARDLSMAHCDTLFGHADPTRGIAVASAFRLRGQDPARLRDRLANVVAHEAGHLRGWPHCPVPGCLMHPARTAGDIDARGWARCGRCPRSRRTALVAALTAPAFLLVFFGLDRLNPVLAGRPERPFKWRAEEEGAEILFRGEHVLRLRAAGGAGPRWEPLVHQLNELYNAVDYPVFEVASAAPDRASILCDGEALLAVLPADANGKNVSALARQWSDHIAELVVGKGWSTESCPACHIHRADEVLRTVRRRWNGE